MAPRKPKNPIKDVGNWLGGAAKGVQSWSESQARTFTNPYINVAGRALGKNPNLPTSGVREAVSNTAFAAVDVAAPVIGRAAGKAVTAVGRSGVVKRSVQRTLKRDEVFFMHGSPKKGLKEIEPRLPPEATKIKGSSKGMFEGMEIDPLTWGTMVSHPSPIGKTKPVWKATKETLISRAEKAYEYTGPKMSPNYTGSLYIAKSPRKGVEDYGEEMITPSIAKVVREIRVAGKSREQVYEEALKELKGLGMKIPKSRGGAKKR
jgi:hypothetical protein